MGDIVTLADLKTAEREDGSEHDDELNQIIARVEARFQGEIGQRSLVETTYTDEKYTGDGTNMLYLRNYPLQDVTSVAIEDETDIDLSDDDVIRFALGNDSDGILHLVERVWTKAKVYNITVTYDAGYSSSTIATDIPDAWDLLLNTCTVLYHGNHATQKELQSQSHMSGAVTYFRDGQRDSDWYRQVWKPVVNRYKRWQRPTV